jgi:asparagine synthase (glutamine-hydrolysing)
MIYVLRKSMSGLLPRELMRMEKQPYRAPDAGCFFENCAGDVADAKLSHEFIARKGYFDPIYTDRRVAKCRGNPNIGFKDNMAFVGILSTRLLDQLYLRDLQVQEEIPAERVRISG